jgi:pimeloyl-ACP methyl ester carboxylesterase
MWDERFEETRRTPIARQRLRGGVPVLRLTLIPDALRLRCPHLAIFGADDELVPVADSIRLFTAAACHRDRDSRATLTVEVFPGADHRVRTDGTSLAPGYLDTLTRGITGRTGDQGV